MSPAQTIHLPTFSGGIVLAGSPDAAQSDELELCDDLDIGPRGQLTPASILDNYVVLDDDNGNNPLVYVAGVGRYEWPDGMLAFVVGHGVSGSGFQKYYRAQLDPSSSGTPVSASLVGVSGAGAGTVVGHGGLATFAQFSYVKDNKQLRPLFVNIGQRIGQASDAAGLYVLTFDPSTSTYSWRPISDYDALGTGVVGEFAGGTKGKQLYFRGIEAYANHLFGWGFDNADSSGATRYEGPNRLMFSNLGNPFKWGNDNIAASGDRDFSDTDAITIGGPGEIMKCGLTYAKRLWLGTSEGLHYLEGYGRESFIADGAHGIRRSLDVTGPHGMCEGVDARLYGVSKRGLWVYGGDSVEHLYRKLVDYADRSAGYWDHIWTDTSRGAGMPGKSNADLVWLMSYPQRRQVWVVIPWCSIANGGGYGTDTVVIKYHVDTDAFSRQLFSGVVLMHGAHFPKTHSAPERTVIGMGNSNAFTLQHYAKRTDPLLAPTPVSTTAKFRTRPHAQFGPNGVGVYRRAYLSFAWDGATNPIEFTVLAWVDDQLIDTIIVHAANVAPATTKLWLDTSGTDTNLGNATAGAIIAAAADWVLKRHLNGAWQIVPGFAGQKGARAMIPILFKPQRGNRISFEVQRTTTGARQFQIEGLGTRPIPLAEAA